jgi:hypothetical protein
MTSMTSSAASETDRARNTTSGLVARTSLDHRAPAATGEVHVDQHDLRAGGPDGVDRLIDIGRLADELDAMPRRSAGTAWRSNPVPRSRT